MKKDDNNLIQYKLLFETQNKEGNYTGPDLLFYYNKILACLLANQYTPLSIVNNVRANIYRVIPYPNNKNISSKNIRANKK